MTRLKEVKQYVAAMRADVDKWDAKADAAILKAEGARLRRELEELMTTPPTAEPEAEG
jgi:hypothetical protein